MPSIIEPEGYATEERLKFSGDDSRQIIVVSGYAQVLINSGTDHWTDPVEAHLTVGPYLKGIRHVSPLVTVAWFQHLDSDEDDNSGWGVRQCPWDIVSGLDGVDSDFERVLLRPLVWVEGENARIFYLGYHVVIDARMLAIEGDEGMRQPPPAHY